MATRKISAWHLYELIHEVTDIHASADVVFNNDENLTIIEDGKIIGFIDLYQHRVNYYPEPVPTRY